MCDGRVETSKIAPMEWGEDCDEVGSVLDELCEKDARLRSKSKVRHCPVRKIAQ